VKVDILDQGVFNSLSPSELESYLAHTDWVRLKIVSGEVAIWQHTTDSHKHRVWIPLDQTLADYAESMSRAIKAIASVETRSQLQILDDLETTAVGDIIRVKSFDILNRESNSLPFHEGMSLLRQAQDMTSAAAVSAVEKREVLSRRRPNKAVEYLKELRMGQTERGSFVVKLISPIHPDPAPQMPFEFPDLPIIPEPPFERQVVINLLSGLHALKRVSEEISRTGRFHLEAFQEAVQEGVSANLCEAVANVSDDDVPPRPLEVNISWSYAIPAPRIALPTEVRFSTEAMPYIVRAAQLFRERNPEEIIIRGYVTALRREKDAQAGVITVTGLIEGKVRSIRLPLVGALYTIAVQAHENESEVSCEGRLVKQGNFFTLEDPLNFHIIREE
jgi:hypothetical protein